MQNATTSATEVEGLPTHGLVLKHSPRRRNEGVVVPGRKERLPGGVQPAERGHCPQHLCSQLRIKEAKICAGDMRDLSEGK